jgi:glycosyltransferase involved in cell wall biosynthesis
MADGVREAEALSRLVPELRCRLVPLAVDTDSFRPGDGPANDTIRPKQILTVSRLHPIKRQVELVQAFGRVSSRFATWELVIAGPEEDPAYRRRIEVTAASLGIADRVRLVGPLEGQRLVDCYREAQVFVLASASESAGLAIVEALAVGLPVVATTGTPWRELVDGRCGWWVDPGVDGLTDGLDQAMSAGDELLSEMGRRARRLAVTRYSLDALRGRLSEAYADATAQRPHTASC